MSNNYPSKIKLGDSEKTIETSELGRRKRSWVITVDYNHIKNSEYCFQTEISFGEHKKICEKSIINRDLLRFDSFPYICYQKAVNVE